MAERFWETVPLEDMSKDQWESLCDGCGKCCLIRMEDEDNGDIYVTDIACKLLDQGTCRCKDYAGRKAVVPDCVQLTPGNVGALKWMPQTCAYRLIHEGKPLFDWHYLISGSLETIHEQGMSVKDATISELKIKPGQEITRITVWPGEPDVGE